MRLDRSAVKSRFTKQITLAVFLFLVVWSAAPPFTTNAATTQTPAVVEINVDTTKVMNTMRGGIGASWHAIETPIPIGHGGSAWGAYPPAEDERAWQQIYRHANWLGLDWNRVEIEQRIYEPARDRFTFDSPEMRILYRILDWNQKHGTDVFFQQMWCNTDWLAYPQSREDPIARVHSAPQDVKAFADGLATLMEYLIKKRGYTCIKWLCINNEPGASWSWWQSPANHPLSIGPGLAAVRRALAGRGLDLPLSGPDAGLDLFSATLSGFDHQMLLGAYDFHDYESNFDFRTGGHIAEEERNAAVWVKFAHDQGKPLFLSEFGVVTFGGRHDTTEPGSAPAVLAASELVIRGANIGVDGFNRWSFLNRGDLDGQWQYIDTWDPNHQKLLTDFTPHPNSYFGLGLLSRFTAKHSAVLATAVGDARVKGWQRVFCAAFRSPKGNLTLAVVNDAPVEFALRLAWAGKAPEGKFYRYHYTEAERDRVDVKVNPHLAFSSAPRNDVWQDTLPPNSLTIYSTYDLNHNDPGILLDDANDGNN
jgi:hypothetical protein